MRAPAPGRDIAGSAPPLGSQPAATGSRAPAAVRGSLPRQRAAAADELARAMADRILRARRVW